LDLIEEKKPIDRLRSKIYDRAETKFIYMYVYLYICNGKVPNIWSNVDASSSKNNRQIREDP